jgi:hypothetical protein
LGSSDGHYAGVVVDESQRMNAEDITRYLTELNDELRAMDVKGEICLYGGAVMALVYNARPDTEDVDAIFEPIRSIRIAARKVAERNGLELGWLNTAVEMFLAPHDKKIFLDQSNLKIFVPPSDYLLAMKTLSARANTMDREDLQILIRDIGLKHPEEIFQIVKNYYPHKEMKPASRILILELFDDYAKRNKAKDHE